MTARALTLVGDITIAAAGVPIEAASFSYGAAPPVVVPLAENGPVPRLEVIDRRRFDSGLVVRAGEAGAALHSARVRDVSGSQGRWLLTVRSEDDDQSARTLEAGWIIGADGPGSLVRKRVSQPFAKSELSVACGYFVDGVTSNRIDIVFEDSPPGYLWSFPRRDHLAVGVCAQADVASVGSLMPIVDRWVERNVAGGKRRRYSWPIPSLTARAIERERPAGDGWILVGDAAGLVDPITREGIFFALESAAAAADAIASRPDPAAHYATRLRDTVYRELATAARIKARFYRPAFMTLLLRALERSARIRAIMADLVAGEQPYRTLRRRLLRTMEWKLMVELFRDSPVGLRGSGLEV